MEESTDIEILKLLLKATQRKLMIWKSVENDERDLFYSEIGRDSFEIELIHLQRLGETINERALARIQGKKIYQTYAIGTEGYNLLLSILRENIFGWKEGFTNTELKLKKLKERLETVIT